MSKSCLTAQPSKRVTFLVFYTPFAPVSGWPSVRAGTSGPSSPSLVGLQFRERDRCFPHNQHSATTNPPPCRRFSVVLEADSRHLAEHLRQALLPHSRFSETRATTHRQAQHQACLAAIRAEGLQAQQRARRSQQAPGALEAVCLEAPLGARSQHRRLPSLHWAQHRRRNRKRKLAVPSACSPNPQRRSNQ